MANYDDIDVSELLDAVKSAEMENDETVETSANEGQADKADVTEPAVTFGAKPKKRDNTVLSIDPFETVVNRKKGVEDSLWHDITNARLTKRIMVGIVESVEKIGRDAIVVTTSYMGQRIIIPIDEMGINLPEGDPTQDKTVRRAKLANTMLGAEIDFIILKEDRKSRAVVASRKAAMMMKKREFFGTLNGEGVAKVHEGRIVEARVIGVSEKKVRFEVFGAEVSVHASNLSWEWVADARDDYYVGDRVLLNISKVFYPDGEPNDEWLDNITVDAEAKSLIPNHMKDNFELIKEQGKYLGTITDVHNQTYFIHLDSGVNAISHMVNGTSIPMKKDRIAFACTRKDHNTTVAIGIITRVIQSKHGR